MASIDEKVVSIKLNDKDLQVAVTRVIKALNELNKALKLNDAAKGFDKLDKSAKKVKFDKIEKEASEASKSINKMADSSSKSLSDINKAAGKVDLSEIGSDAQKMSKNVSNASSDASDSIQDISKAGNNVDLSNIGNSAQKAASSVESASSEASSSIQKIGNAGDSVNFNNVSQSAQSMSNTVQTASARAASSVNEIASADDRVTFETAASSAQKMSSTIQEASAQATNSVQKIDAADDKVNFDNTASSAQKMSSIVQNSSAQAATSIQQVESASNRVTLSTVTSAFQKFGIYAQTAASNVQSALDKISTSKLVNELQNANESFSKFESVATVATGNIVANIASKIPQAISSMTAGISSGFHEYETQLNAVQTILANTQKEGTNVTRVNQVLDQLNTYADQTIYNFTEMTKNIGTFTAAGVGLQDSADAIKGIANLAAMSGSSSAQASSAMYQLSQALAAGKVSLMDWNSVVNAGMGGQVFQDALKQTAKHMGIVVDESKSFRDSISAADGNESWLTSGVLIETLKQLGGVYDESALKAQGWSDAEIKQILSQAQVAQDAATKVKTFTQLVDTAGEEIGSGWAQTFKILFGNFDEAKALWTDWSNSINSIIQANSTARNALLSEGFSSGYNQLINQGILDTERFNNILTEMGNKAWDASKHGGQGFDDMIEKAGGLQASFHNGWVSSDLLKQSVNQLTNEVKGYDAEKKRTLSITDDQIKQLEQLNEGLQNGSISADEMANKFSRLSGRENIATGLKNIFNDVVSLVNAFKSGWSSMVKGLSGEELYQITVKFREFTEGLKPTPNTLKLVTNAAKGLGAVFNVLSAAALLVAKGIIALVKVAAKIGSVFLKAVAGVGSLIAAFYNYVQASGIIQDAITAIQNVLNGFGKALEPVGEAVEGFFDGLTKGAKDGTKDFPDILGTIGDTLVSASKDVDRWGTEIQQSFHDRFGGVADVAREVSDKVAQGFEALQPVFDWISNKVDIVADHIKTFFSDLNGNITLDNILGLINSGLMTGVLLGLRKFIKGLNDAGKEIKKETFSDALKEVLDRVKDSFKDFTDSFNIISVSSIAASIALLAKALKELSTIEIDKLAPALGALTGVVAVMAAFMVGMARLATITKKVGKTGTALMFGFSALNQMALAMISLGSAMYLMAKAAHMLKDMDPVQIAVIFGAMSVAMLSIGGSVALIGLVKPKQLEMAGKAMKSIGFGFILVAASMLVFAKAIQMLANINLEKLSNASAVLAAGLVTMSVALAGLAWMSSTGDMYYKAGAGMLAMAAALLVFAEAVRVIANVKPAALARSCGVLAGAIVVMSAALAGLAWMSSTGNTYTKAGVAMMAFATAMLVLAIPIKMLSGMQLTALAKGVGSVATMMVVMAGSVALMSKFDASNMYGSAAAMLAMATGLTVMSVAVKMLSSVPLSQLEAGLGTVIGLMLALVGSVKLLSSGNLLEVSAGIAAFSGALVVMAVAMKMMSSIPFDGIVSGLSAFYGVLFGLVFASKMLGPFATQLMALSKAVAVFGVAILAMGAGIALAGAGLVALSASGSAAAGILANALNVLIQFIPVLIKSLMTAIVGALAIINAALPQILESLGSIVTQLLAWLTTQIPAIAEATVTMIDQVLQKVAAHSETITENLVKILVDILNAVANHAPEITEAVGRIFEAIFSAIGTAAATGNATALFGAVATLGLLGVMFKQLAAMKKDAVNALVSTSVMLLVITALAGILAAMSALNVQNALANSASLSSLILAMTGSIKILSTVNEGGTLTKLLPSMAMLLGIVSALALILSAMSSLNIQNALPNAVALGTLMIAMSGSLKLMSMISPMTGSAISAMIAMTAVTAALALILAAMSALNVKNALPNAVALSTLLLAISAALVILKAVPAGAALPAVTNLGIAIAGIATILVAAGALSQIPGFDWLVGEGGQLLVKIGTILGQVIGSFIGAIAGSAIEQIASSLPTLAEALSSFATKLTPFITTMKLIDSSVVDAAGNIANMILKLTAANLLDGITKFLTGGADFSSLGPKLVAFGHAIVDFSSIVSGQIDGSAIQTAANAGQILTNLLNNLPSSDGLLQTFIGGKDWSTISNGLRTFGTAIATFSSTVAGKIDEAAVQSAANAGKTLSQLLTALPTGNGLWQKIAGGQNWSTISTGLSGLADALVSYSKKVSGKGFDASAISASVPAVKSFINMLNTMPKSGGVAGFFTGKQDFSQLSSSLSALADGLKAYVDKLKGVNLDSLTASIGSIKTLKSAMAGDFKVGSFSGFASAAKEVGSGLSSYANAIKGGSFDKVQSSISSLRSLRNVLAGFNGIEGKTTGFITAATQAGIGLKNYSNNVSGIENIGTSLTNLAALRNALAKFQPMEDKTTGFITACRQASAGLKAFISGTGSLGEVDIDWATSSLGKVRNALAKFQPMEDKTTGFITACRQASAGLKAFISGTGSLGEVDIDWATSSLGKVRNALAKFQPMEDKTTGFITACRQASAGLKAFITNVSAVGNQDVSTSISMVNKLRNALVEFSSISIEATWTQGFITAATQASVGLKNFVTNTSGISLENTIVAIASLKSLKNALTSFPALDGATTGFITAATQAGVGLKNFATNTVGIAVETITSSISAVKSLANAMASLAGKDFSGVLTFKNTMAQAGDLGLTSFNTALAASVANVGSNFAALSNTILTQTGSLTAALGTMQSALTAAASTVSIGFVSAINAAHASVASSMNGIVSTISSGGYRIQSNSQTIVVAAQSMQAGMQSAFAATVSQISAASNSIANTISNMGSRIISSINSIIPSARTTASKLGSEIANGVRDGINRNTSGAVNAAKSLGNKVANAINDGGAYRTAVELGADIASGLAIGISNNKYLATNAGSALGKAALEAAKEAVASHSPSKKFIELGMYMDQGLAIGLDKYSDMAEDKSVKMASKVLDATQSVINSLSVDPDFNPTIRPVVDLSDVKKQSANIKSMMASNSTFDMNGNSTRLINRFEGDFTRTSSNKQTQPNQVINNYEFTQNNTSPKALDAIDIYRQTKSAMSRLKNQKGFGK